MLAEAALLILQDKVELSPVLRLLGLAEKLVMMGRPGVIGFEEEDAGPVPIALMAVTVKV